MKRTDDIIELTEDNEIFVFGSNESGIHGAGAAKFALDNYGAIWGQGYGLQGISYAIPTKDKYIRTLPLSDIVVYVEEFIEDAKAHQELQFIVTPIGCGLAGYKPSDITPMFSDVPENVILPKEILR